MYTTIYAKVQINGDTHDEVMPDIVVKQGCHLSPTLFGLHIDDYETYLEETNGHTPCLFNTNILTLLCVADVVMPLCQKKKKKRPSTMIVSLG